MWPSSGAARLVVTCPRESLISSPCCKCRPLSRCIADKVKCTSNQFESLVKKHRLRKTLMLFFPASAAIKSNGDVFPRVAAANHLLSCRLSSLQLLCSALFSATGEGALCFKKKQERHRCIFSSKALVCSRNNYL